MERVWNELGDGRECYEHPAGFSIIRPVGSQDPVPLFCLVCGYSMLTPDDAHTHHRHTCCSLCALKWVDLNKEAWALGWRPPHEEVTREVTRRRARMKRINF